MGGPVQVGYSVVDEQNVALRSELTGRISAVKTAEVRPAGGRGDRGPTRSKKAPCVNAGQPLYRWIAAPFRAAYDSARAHVASAEAAAQSARQRAERFARLVQTGAVSRDANEEVQSLAAQSESAVGVARAQVETARISLDYTKVRRAPIAGRTGRSLAYPRRIGDRHGRAHRSR
jgi:membrane fusion protein (multidrug efflux system)